MNPQQQLLSTFSSSQFPYNYNQVTVSPNQVQQQQANFLPQSPAMISSLQHPTSSPSIDALINRMHSLARDIHALGQSANSQVQGMASRGEQSLDRFDSNFGAITGDVGRVFGEANQRATDIPAWLLILLGSALALLLVLGLGWLLALAAERICAAGGRGGGAKQTSRTGRGEAAQCLERGQQPPPRI